jgi:hypothetical protein
MCLDIRRDVHKRACGTQCHGRSPLYHFCHFTMCVACHVDHCGMHMLVLLRLEAGGTGNRSEGGGGCHVSGGFSACGCGDRRYGGHG